MTAATPTIFHTASTPVSPRPRSAHAIAPWWHTVALIAFFLLMAAAGALLQSQAAGRPGLVQAQARPSLAGLYLSLIVGEWALVYYVWKVGLRRASVSFGELIGGRWDSWRAFTRDVLLGLALCLLWKSAYSLWSSWFGTGHAPSIAPLLPQGPLESVLWVFVSASAGISEEFVFRGYFQRQFQSWTGHPATAALLQVALFAIAHGYQGARSCLAIAAYGVLFTLLALYRKSLRPGMLAHTFTDIAGGLR